MIYLKVKIVKDKEVIYESAEKNLFGFKFEYSNKKAVEFEYTNLENADLENANLYNANLENAILKNANLENANLENANLHNANLEKANLYNANLENADLYNADLYNAILCNANLYNADLYNAILCNANLYNANLKNAILYNANLYNANLYNANLKNANLENANLYNANLDEKEQIRKGKIINKKTIVYKKSNNKIIELELQKGSIVFSINNHKCRTNKAKVISIDGKKTKGLTINSDYNSNFIYEVGKTVEVEDFNLMYNVECSKGIHFFWDRKDAENY